MPKQVNTMRYNDKDDDSQSKLELVSGKHGREDSNLKKNSNQFKWDVYIENTFGLIEPKKDADGKFGGLCLPQYIANYLWFLSWLSLVSGLFAIVMHHYDLCAVPLGVWFTSILYWAKPDYSWRRYFDITYVHLSLTYQLIRARDAEYRVAYYITVGIGMIAFPIAMYFKNKSTWMSTFFHGLVHVFGNISNIILYAGNVPPPV